VPWRLRTVTDAGTNRVVTSRPNRSRPGSKPSGPVSLRGEPALSCSFAGRGGGNLNPRPLRPEQGLESVLACTRDCCACSHGWPASARIGFDGPRRQDRLPEFSPGCRQAGGGHVGRPVLALSRRFASRCALTPACSCSQVPAGGGGAVDTTDGSYRRASSYRGEWAGSQRQPSRAPGPGGGHGW
jgi:hypothetical protein